MTREEAVKEIEKAFEPVFANYIITALTEGATVSDKEQGTTYIQAIYTEALEEGIRCAMCTNTIKSDTGCDGGCIVDTKMYNKVMTEINSRLLRLPSVTPQEPILDKIRAEIVDLGQRTMNDNRASGIWACRDIIDKYKAESEVNNGTDIN